MASIAIVYHSGYGHTQRQAEAIAEGVRSRPDIQLHLVAVTAEGLIDDAQWEALDAANAIIFGSPTYMGGPTWQFKRFADASSKAWFIQKWKDKLAAGFTNSASINGDKQRTLDYLQTFAMQHGMVWIGTGILPNNMKSAQRNDINWLGSFSGLMAQSPSDSSPEEGPLPGDLQTAVIFGKRIAKWVLRLVG